VLEAYSSNLIKLKNDKKADWGYPQSRCRSSQITFTFVVLEPTHMLHTAFVYASSYAAKPNAITWALTDSSPKAQDNNLILFHA